MVNYRLESGLYVPQSVSLNPWLQGASCHSDAHGLELVTVARTWEDFAQLMINGLVMVGLVSTRDHLDPGRVPRVEVIDELEPPPIPGQRRPRWSR